MASAKSGNSAEIRNRIKKARENMKLTQATVAAYLGMTRTSITQWEGGLTFPSYDKIIELAELFRVSPEWLAFGVKKSIEYQVPENTLKIDIIEFGETSTDRIAVWSHYLSASFVRDILRINSKPEDIFIHVLTSKSFSPRYNPQDSLVVDGASNKVGEGLHLIWNGLAPQIVDIQANLSGDVGTVILKTSDAAEDSKIVNSANILVLGKVKGILAPVYS